MKKRGLLLFITSAALLLFAGCSDNDTQLESGNQQEKSSESIRQEKSSAQSSSNSTNASAQNSSNTTSKQLSLNEIIALYQKIKPNTDITDIDIESRINELIYEVKGMDDSKEYKLTFSETGELQRQNEEKLDADERNEKERNNEKLDLKNLLSLDKINSIAKKEVDGNIVEWSLERELSKTYWEVKVEKNGQQTDISIDAQSGNVLEVEVDD